MEKVENIDFSAKIRALPLKHQIPARIAMGCFFGAIHAGAAVFALSACSLPVIPLAIATYAAFSFASGCFPELGKFLGALAIVSPLGLLLHLKVDLFSKTTLYFAGTYIGIILGSALGTVLIVGIVALPLLLTGLN